MHNRAASPQPYSPLNWTLRLGLVYLLLAMILTWPTVSHLTSHVPGDGADDPAIAWNLWWVKQALLVEGQNPFHSTYMFYPLGINLAFYTLTVLNGLTTLPLLLNWGVVTTSNLHLLFTFVVGAYGAFLLTRYLLAGPAVPRSQPAPRLVWLSAAAAGCFYAFASSTLFYVSLGQFNIASHHWVPFTALFVIRMQQQPQRYKNAGLAALFLTMQAWAELTYASFLLILIGLYWLYGLTLFALRRRGASSSPRSHLTAGLILILTFGLGLSPILAQMIPDMLAEGDFWVVGEGFAQSFSADLFGFIIPTMRHPWLGQLIQQTGIKGYNLGQHIYAGLLLPALILFNWRSIYRQPALRFWLLAGLIFALLALGPKLTINGQTTPLPGPFNLLQQLPFFKGNRYPSRYSVMLMLSLTVPASYGLLRLGQWLERRRPAATPFLLTGLTLLFLLEHLALPLPQSDLRSPAAYQIIAADQADVTVLDIPFAWRNGFRVTGALTTQFMFGQFYQTTHGKRLLQGNTSRNPEFKFQYFTTAPVLNSLLALQTGKTVPAERWAADQKLAAAVLDFFNVGYIVVRPDLTGNPKVTPQATLPYIEAVLPVTLIHDSAGIKIYRVDQAEAGPAGLRLETGSPLAPLYFAEGWGWLSPDQPLVAQRRRTRLLLPLPGQVQRLTLRLRLPEVFTGSEQTVGLAINGWQAAPHTLGRDWGDYSFQLPAGVVRPGLNEVWLEFAQVSRLPRPQAGQPVLDVTVLSAGEEVGNFGHIFVNGYDLSANLRGYNALRLAPDGGFTLANFDTHLDPTAATALAEFIRATPPESRLALAAADEASQRLTEPAVLALASLGASGDLRGCFRCSHALIGRPGSRPGSAAEALDALSPAGVTSQLGLTEPTVAALLEAVWVEAVEE